MTVQDSSHDDVTVAFDEWWTEMSSKLVAVCRAPDTNDLHEVSRLAFVKGALFEARKIRVQAEASKARAEAAIASVKHR